MRAQQAANTNGHSGNGTDDGSSSWSARLAALEAQVVAMDMLLSSIVMTSSHRALALDRLERDIGDWANRVTASAHTPLAKTARINAKQILLHLRDLSDLEFARNDD
jgi:hypothetical protein